MITISTQIRRRTQKKLQRSHINTTHSPGYFSMKHSWQFCKTYSADSVP